MSGPINGRTSSVRWYKLRSISIPLFCYSCTLGGEHGTNKKHGTVKKGTTPSSCLLHDCRNVPTAMHNLPAHILPHKLEATNASQSRRWNGQRSFLLKANLCLFGQLVRPEHIFVCKFGEPCTHCRFQAWGSVCNAHIFVCRSGEQCTQFRFWIWDSVCNAHISVCKFGEQCTPLRL